MELYDLQVFKSANVQSRISAGMGEWITYERKFG